MYNDRMEAFKSKKIWACHVTYMGYMEVDHQWLRWGLLDDVGVDTAVLLSSLFTY